ncbi:lytic polysaccharide monooxygenase [Amniculicola lignicola CBS 123094]|uniref:Lytic polysaccharide monooxygenase n=1 Tax=Amniculicola lignicola CBS 123094 TaxID=1392246 RepID=A0A6A5W425_9PLEO|nr:lytic polysaccharide monooxygenase [Amniculicola lignicola CBS 123094]
MAPLALLSLSLALLPTLISAHGHVSGIVVDGKWYTGWNAAMKYQSPIPPTAGWQVDNLDNGFVTPSQFATADIICHKAAKNGGLYIPAKAGAAVKFLWDAWPVSHKGPVIDYIAPCPGDCTSVDKTTLRWTKIKEGAWITGSDPGTWVTDDLVKSNLSWTTTIPSTLASGNYIIRHEIIALHAAGQSNGAQAYPQCINFKVEGTGSETLSGGVAATAFYKATDAGILFNLYSKFTGYTIPGPALKMVAKREAAVVEERGHAKDWLRELEMEE